jgi:hypothetical protein
MTDDPNVDDRVDMLLTRAKSDPDAAALALQWMAMSLRKYGKMPQGLADHLADAIEASMGKPAKHRAKALTDELGLTAKNRRLAADVFTVAQLTWNLRWNAIFVPIRTAKAPQKRFYTASVKSGC